MHLAMYLVCVACRMVSTSSTAAIALTFCLLAPNTAPVHLQSAWYCRRSNSLFQSFCPLHPSSAPHRATTLTIPVSPPTDLHLDVVAGLATKRDPTVTPPDRFDHTLVRGEILYTTIWTVGRRGGSEGHFSRQFPTPEGSKTSAKKRSEIYPLFTSITLHCGPSGACRPRNERKEEWERARAGAGTVSDADAWRLHLRRA